MRRFMMVAACLGVLTLALAVTLFPGERLALALTLGTGWDQPALQARVDALEGQAVAGEPFTEDDEAFLVDLYRTMATGGRLSMVIGQSGRMMDHYLDRTGEALVLEPDIFTGSREVFERMTRMRWDVEASGCEPVTRTTPSFYMPDERHLDAHFGLYHGTLRLEAEPTADGRCALSWRAEVPWTWPSHAELTARRGDPLAERFPIPNLRSLLFGAEHALLVGNGLGAHLEQLGLAKPFIARAEWRESITLPTTRATL